ncbi:MAG TPA: hypothetical protein VE842_12125, partial [Pyrinomonadaceae bacterium]|nr:hypothetical protein [Pyrinomonadaceae bacterium]
LSMVALSFKIGEQVFERRTALVAASVVALWPSLLLHTTQLLRDPLFILMMLVMVLIWVRWLRGKRTLRGGLTEGFVCGAASVVVWVTRYNMWAMVILFTLVAALFLIVRQLRERRWLTGNVAGAALLLLMIGSTPSIVGRFLQPDVFISDPEVPAEAPSSIPLCLDEPTASAASINEDSSIWSRLLARADSAVMRVGKIRRAFDRSYANAGSNMDACVRLSSVSDLLRYLPRALSHGFLAPYPSMWTSEGNSVGRSGRLLSGAEMTALYLIELLAVFGVWRGRRSLPVWFIAIVAIAGIAALGFAVANAAILFRLRYVFMILVIILGAGGSVEALSLLGAKRARFEGH